jgi:hypothetical protein
MVAMALTKSSLQRTAAADAQAIGPFLFFDHFGPVEGHPGDNHDVRPHPHIGLATVTYLFEGAIVHRDSLGSVQRIEPGAINTLVETIREDAEVKIATLAVLISNPADIMDPNVVKVVLDFDGNALYFSRAPIPWVRDRRGPVHARHLKHLGLYGFRRSALLDFPTFPQGDLERIEQLEQLRWLENGYRIRVAETEYDSVSVDVAEDVERVERLLANL